MGSEMCIRDSYRSDSCTITSSWSTTCFANRAPSTSSGFPFGWSYMMTRNSGRPRADDWAWAAFPKTLWEMTTAGTPLFSRLIPSRTEPEVHEPQAETPTKASFTCGKSSMVEDPAGEKVLGLMTVIVSDGSKRVFISSSRFFRKGSTDTWPLNKKAILLPPSSGKGSIPVARGLPIQPYEETNSIDRVWASPPACIQP